MDSPSLTRVAAVRHARKGASKAYGRENTWGRMASLEHGKRIFAILTPEAHHLGDTPFRAGGTFSSSADVVSAIFSRKFISSVLDILQSNPDAFCHNNGGGWMSFATMHLSRDKNISRSSPWPTASLGHCRKSLHDTYPYDEYKVFSLAETSSTSNSMGNFPISSSQRYQFGRTEAYLELSLRFSGDQRLECLEECADGPQCGQCQHEGRDFCDDLALRMVEELYPSAVSVWSDTVLDLQRCT